MLNLGRKRLGLPSPTECNSFSTAVEVVAVVADALVEGRGLFEVFADEGDSAVGSAFP